MNEIKRVSCGTVNCYLVSQQGKTILIDTGTAAYRKKVLKECKNANVQLIILTHGHCDHIQNTVFLSRKLKAPVAMSDGDIELIEDNLKQPLYAKGLFGKFLRFYSVFTIKYMKKRKAMEQFCPNIILKDGMNLDEFGIQAEVVGLPGHTKGSIGILVGGKDFFIGDALMNMTVLTLPRIYTDEEQMRKSADKIWKMKNTMIYFGHGKQLRN